MKINKQLFEDVLSGKLKGTFVLKNGKKFNDNLLTDIYKSTVVLGKTTYYFNGKPIVSDYNGILDIVDFIPDTIEIDPEMYSYNEKDIQFIKQFINSYYMKENELTIEIPDGMCIDESKSTFEKIVFKKKEDTKPRSWEEYCNNYFGKVFYIEKNSTICGGNYTQHGLFAEVDKNILPAKELAEAFLAMMQLMSLRQAWIGNWKSDWKDRTKRKYCLCQSENIIRIDDFWTGNRVLSFPTEEMATDFMNTFKDLLETAKPLI